MNRYTYKAKIVDNGEWVYGSLIYSSNSESYYIDYSIEEDYDSCKEFGGYDYKLEVIAAEINPETICQCTGLKDKNGNYIFENDILEITYGSQKERSVVKYGNFNCSCCDGVYGYFLENGDIRDLEDDTESKVVGNKFDNIGDDK